KQRLEELRINIDKIDSQILDLINSRLVLGKKIGQIKQKSKTDVLDPSREKQVIEKILNKNKGPAEEQLLKYIFNVIMTATKDIQKRQIISFLGPEAGYPHIASLNYFKHSGRFVEQSNIYEVFRNTNRNESHFGVVPVENSIQGSVNHTLDLFSEFDDLNICGEHYEPISYDLISLSGEKDDIKTIYASSLAISQCKIWKGNNFANIDLIELASTAKAAEMAFKDTNCAIIANSQAAHIYSFKVVESAIEDYPGNITRFLIIGKDTHKKTGNDKTSIMFSTSHIPGALFKALEPVNKSELNMLKLESRPTKHENWSYYFFMDIQGHIKDKIVKETIEKMKETTLSLKHLGSYPVFDKENN
ncbi:MAG: prephenate dehydratase, partial [Desulfobacteraceae bacterium]|nr:prephenate dehydratase [Desulfobacteraceae bacterium]